MSNIGLSYLLLNYAELIEDKNIHEFMLFDEVKELRQAVDELKGVKRPVCAVMVPMFSKKGGLTNE